MIRCRTPGPGKLDLCRTGADLAEVRRNFLMSDYCPIRLSQDSETSLGVPSVPFNFNKLRFRSLLSRPRPRVRVPSSPPYIPLRTNMLAASDFSAPVSRLSRAAFGCAADNSWRGLPFIHQERVGEPSKLYRSNRHSPQLKSKLQLFDYRQGSARKRQPRRRDGEFQQHGSYYDQGRNIRHVHDYQHARVNWLHNTSAVSNLCEGDLLMLIKSYLRFRSFRSLPLFMSIVFITGAFCIVVPYDRETF